MEKKLNIALLVGGTSPERSVSKASGKAVYRALLDLGYNVKAIDPAYGNNQPENVDDLFCTEDYTEISNQNYIEAINSPLMEEIDLAFLALHGKWGEDGTLQALLELKDIKYTGSGVLASSLAMDKCMTKIMFQHYNVATPKWIIVKNGEKDFDSIKEKLQSSFGYPAVVKPNDQGSTVGLSIVKSESEIKDAILLALKYSDTALIEEFIPGRELTVSILDSTALPVIEIRPKHDHYDFECKYTKGMSEYIVPAEIPEYVTQNLQHQAMLAFKSVGCKGYSRVDFRVTDDFKTFCLEVNTLPGMTDTSLVPKAAKAAGISFEELIDMIIKFAL